MNEFLPIASRFWLLRADWCFQLYENERATEMSWFIESAPHFPSILQLFLTCISLRPTFQFAPVSLLFSSFFSIFVSYFFSTSSHLSSPTSLLPTCSLPCYINFTPPPRPFESRFIP